MGDKAGTFLTASELSLTTGIPQMTLRNWARKGMLPSQIDGSRQRKFEQAAIKRAKELRDRKCYKLAEV